MALQTSVSTGTEAGTMGKSKLFFTPGNMGTPPLFLPFCQRGQPLWLPVCFPGPSKRGLLLKERICSIRSKFFPSVVDPH